jgi:putative transposase
MRKTPFITGEYYHIYNQGVDKRNIFLNTNDFARFLKSMAIFNTVEPVGSLYEYVFDLKSGRRSAKSEAASLIDIICFCLNPNHYHIVLRQRLDGGVSEFMKRLSGGYTQGFNRKYRRRGALFQGKFKSSHIDSNEYLLHISAYVNLNNRVHRLKAGTSVTSWDEYMRNKKQICKKSIILKQFRDKKEYKEFALSTLQDIQERKKLSKELEKLLLE